MNTIVSKSKLPADWEVVRLGQYIEEKKERNKNELELPVYSVSNIYGFILSEEFFDKRVYSKNLKAYKVVAQHEFAYNPARVNVGSLALFVEDKSGLVSPMYVVFKVKDTDSLSPSFLYLLLKTPRYSKMIKSASASRGSVRKILSFDDLADFQIPLPPLPEQQKIVYVLDAIQEAIGAQERLIEKTKELKRAVMAKLFREGTRGEKLKKTEIGEIPEDWEVVRLGEVYKITHQPPNLDFKNFKSIPFIPMEEVGFGNLNPKYYMKSFDEIPSGVYFEKGDLLLAKITPSFENGKQSIVEDIPLNFGIATTEIIPIKQTPKSNTYYLFYLLQKNDVRNSLAESMEGTTGRRRLSKSVLLNFKIPLPPFPEQQEIVEILQTIDQKIDIEQKKKALYEELFRAMLEKLMTAELRVKDIEFE